LVGCQLLLLLLLRRYFRLGCRCLFEEAARVPLQNSQLEQLEPSEQPGLLLRLVLVVLLLGPLGREGQGGASRRS
jgi:hypothetical protein